MAVWTDGLRETDAIVSEWSDSFAALNSGIIEELTKLRDDATATGHHDVAATIQKDIDTLEKMNAEIDALLKKRQGGYITEAEQLRLDELIDTREAIQVKYNLVPDGVDGYAKILEELEIERARAFARGESDIDVSYYEKALTATAQGHAAVQKSIDERYASEYAVSLDELGDSFSDGSTPEQTFDAKLLDEAINRFLRTLSDDARNTFIGRYYFFDSLKDVAGYCGMSEAKAKSMLYRTRQSLKSYLVKEGFDL